MWHVIVNRHYLNKQNKFYKTKHSKSCCGCLLSASFLPMPPSPSPYHLLGSSITSTRRLSWYPQPQGPCTPSHCVPTKLGAHIYDDGYNGTLPVGLIGGTLQAWLCATRVWTPAPSTDPVPPWAPRTCVMNAWASPRSQPQLATGFYCPARITWATHWWLYTIYQAGAAPRGITKPLPYGTSSPVRPHFSPLCPLLRSPILPSVGHASSWPHLLQLFF